MSRAFSMRRRRFVHLAVPGLLGLSTTLTLGSCGTQNQRAATSTSSSVITAADANPAIIKTKVLHVGYQQAGDLVRVTKVLEKRLEPLGVKVKWAQFAQGPQLMEAMNVGKIDLGSVGETPPIFAQAAGAQIVYVVLTFPVIFLGSAITPSLLSQSLILSSFIVINDKQLIIRG